jgi:peptide/nickel transport system substrate-binding protein
LCLGLVAAACGSSSKKTAAGGAAKKGGSIVLGAEQWASCINPITQCANSSWMFWTSDDYVLPKLMYLDAQNNPQPSALITEAPTEANGGIKTSPFTLTFHLNPKAVWDDKTPITSKDVEFTWQAYLKTKGTLSTVGYDQIDSIDTSSDKTVVIKFKAPFADWTDLFGGNQGHVLKKAAFPNAATTFDLANEMQTSLPFSGMPWKLQSFSKDQAVLVPNINYWVPADIPLLDQVTFVPRTDQDTEINSLLTGEVASIYPQPSPGFSKKLAVANVKYKTGGGTTFEGIWPNLSKPPLNDPKVRQALFMSIDRNEILNTIIKPDVPDAQILNCGGWVPTVGKWCDNTQFADIKYDPEGAKSVLQSDGYTLGSDGVMAKGGQKLDIEFNTVAGNTRRENLQQLIIQEAKKAGIAFHIKNYNRTQLFQDVLPHANFGLGIYAQVASSDPSVTSIFACDQIPSAANQFSGQNDSQYCSQQATDLMKKSDAEVTIDKRLTLIHQVGKAIRDDYVWLPFYQLPLIAAYRTDKVAGPVEDFTLSSYTNFFNVNKWHLP